MLSITHSKGKNRIDKISVDMDILRQKTPESEPHHQLIHYETDDVGKTVAGALTDINEGCYTDAQGKTVEQIRWECSCLQKKCGACAMVIDGRPQLACGYALRDYRGRKPLQIEPLHKFPVVADLIVDRTVMHEALCRMKLWTDDDMRVKDKNSDYAYAASKCLQCGCCLEVCPNYCAGEPFGGAAAFVPAARMMTSLHGDELLEMKLRYGKQVYSGCGKSLACMNICPAGIDAESLLVKSNAVLLRRRKNDE